MMAAVHKCFRSIENSNSWDVGAACAEGFGPALHGMNMEDAGNDEDAGAEDGQDGGKDVKCIKA